MKQSSYLFACAERVPGRFRSRAILIMLGLGSLAACTTPPPYAAETVAANYSPAEPECMQPGLELRAAVVRVATSAGSYGSGVVVAHGLVLTAAHVVTDASALEVGADDQSYTPARVVAVDRLDDLALLEADTGSLPPLPLTQSELSLYEEVWAIGYPLAMDMAVTQGRLQRQANGKLYTSAWITSGASGGGLLRCNGGEYELAGILRDYVAYVRNGDYVNASQSTSTPAHSIRAFIERHDHARTAHVSH